MTNLPRYRLGAEELIELGRSGNAEHLGRRPYFKARREQRKELGIAPVYAPSKLPVALGAFAGLSGVPLATLGASAATAQQAASGLLEKLPSLRGFFAELGALAAKDAKCQVHGLGATEIKNVEVGVSLALGARRAVPIPFTR